MMKAEELRIWNLVKQGQIIELRAKSARVSYVRSDTKEEATALVRYEDLEPMGLTEGWLVKLGFESRTENACNLPCFKRGNITVARWSGGKWKVWYKTVDLFKSPQSVHQLQNLYFALTGEELKTSDNL